MRTQFAQACAPLAGVYWCPHHSVDAVGAYRRECDCRKPRTAMVERAVEELPAKIRKKLDEFPVLVQPLPSVTVRMYVPAPKPD